MLNIFFKSAIYYTVFKKYGKKIALVSLILFFTILINFIYSDIVEYLTLNEMKDKLLYALIGKWLLILLSVLSIVYVIRSSVTLKEVGTEVKPEKKSSQSLTEQSIINKQKLKSHGDLIIEELKKRKTDAK